MSGAAAPVLLDEDAEAPVAGLELLLFVPELEPLVVLAAPVPVVVGPAVMVTAMRPRSDEFVIYLVSVTTILPVAVAVEPVSVGGPLYVAVQTPDAELVTLQLREMVLERG